MVYFAFEPIGLAIVVIGSFMGGFLPLMILIMRCPEARTFLKCQIGGGIIISKTNTAGQREFIHAHPCGTEGQYLAGKNVFGQRETYVRQQSPSGEFSRSCILTGIRRPILDAFSGKTVLVPPQILAAIKVAELDADGKKQLPPDVRRWAENNHVSVTEIETVISEIENLEKPGEKTVETRRLEKSVVYKLFELDSTKLVHYFREHYSQGQFDVLLQKAYQVGHAKGIGLKLAGGGKSNKWLFVGILIFVIITVVGIIGFMAMGGLK